MRRPIVVALAVVVALALVYQLVLRDSRKVGEVRVPTPVAAIGTGSDAVAVGPEGTVLAWVGAPEEGSLPLLPLSEPPPSGLLGGPVLAQVRVLGTAPAALRPHIASSSYGENGVNVELRAGIELRFGEPTQLEAKWKAAAAVLADPTLEAADYVNLYAPRHPSVGGSGHTLPPVP